MPSPTSHFFLLFQQSTVAFFDRMMIYGALDIVFQAIRREAWLKHYIKMAESYEAKKSARGTKTVLRRFRPISLAAMMFTIKDESW